MKRRAVAAAILVALCLVVAACRSKQKPAPTANAPAVTLVVTRDLGSRPVLDKRVAPGQTVMAALQGVAHVSTRYGGRFVQSIDGVAGSLRQARDWTFFVNGLEARVGATDVTVHAGDRVWWDYRPWTDLPTVPAVVGSFPAPFVRGPGTRGSVQVRGSDVLAGALRRDGARVTTAPSVWRVLVGGDRQLRTDPLYRRAVADPLAQGDVVSIRSGRVVAYVGHGSLTPLAGARAAIFAVRQGGGVTLFVAGVDGAAATAAARTLAAHPAVVRDRYAVALDARGRVVSADTP